MAKRDYYTILGLNKKATENEIKKAYRKLARKYHPDLNPGDKQAEERFKEIQEAYDVLTDKEKRLKYDAFGHAAFGAGHTAGGSAHSYKWQPGDFGFSGFDFEKSGKGGFGDILNEMFGRKARGQEGDIFGDIFGQRPAGEKAPQRGKDIQYTMEIDFMDAIKSLSTEISLRRRAAGDERNLKTDRIAVKIPLGVDNGSKVRLAGKGEAGRNGGEPGDLYIVIKVRAHPFFERKGDDIHCEVPVTISEAALGAEIEVPTVDGLTLMTIPPGTQSGQVFRLKGRGAPRLKAQSRGDQYAKVKIVYNKNLDEKLKQLLKEFDSLNQCKPREALKSLV